MQEEKLLGKPRRRWEDIRLDEERKGRVGERKWEGKVDRRNLKGWIGIGRP